MSITTDMIRGVLYYHGGTFAVGEHTSEYNRPDCPLCVLEAVAACKVRQGLLTKITDDPEKVGLPDIRPLNDAKWTSRALATGHLLRLVEAYSGWTEWPLDRRMEIMRRVAVSTVQRIVSALPGLPEHVATQCREAGTLDAARRALLAAAQAKASTATRAALHAAIYAAETNPIGASYPGEIARGCALAASHAARDTPQSADSVLIAAVDLWCEAVATA